MITEGASRQYHRSADIPVCSSADILVGRASELSCAPSVRAASRQECRRYGRQECLRYGGIVEMRPPAPPAPPEYRAPPNFNRLTLLHSKNEFYRRGAKDAE